MTGDRMVWEKTNNQKIPDGWVIHHLNGDHSDDRPENLVCMSNQQHFQVLAVKAKRVRELEERIIFLEDKLCGNELIRSNN